MHILCSIWKIWHLTEFSTRTLLTNIRYGSATSKLILTQNWNWSNTDTTKMGHLASKKNQQKLTTQNWNRSNAEISVQKYMLEGTQTVDEPAWLWLRHEIEKRLRAAYPNGTLELAWRHNRNPKVISNQQIESICSNFQIYFLKLLNVFLQIAKYICSNC